MRTDSEPSHRIELLPGTSVLAMTVAILILLSGCDAARVGYDAIAVGQQLTEDERLPKDAYRSSFGLGYVGGNLPGGFPGELTHGRDFGLLVLTGGDGSVLAKAYAAREFHGYGWLLTYDDRYVVEMEVPQEWFREAPGNWDATAVLSRLEKAMPQLAQRAPAGPPSEGSPGSGPQAKHTDHAPFAGPRELTESIKAYLHRRDTGEATLAERHVGLYYILAVAAVAHVPANRPLSPKRVAQDLLRIAKERDAFAGATREGYSFSRRGDMGYRFGARNVGGNRIRVEITQRRHDSAFFGVSYP